VTRRPQRPMKRDLTSSSYRTTSQICRLGTDGAAGCIPAALKVDEGDVLDWAVADDGADDAVGDWVVVWVAIWLCDEC
jgi:hypothetical protein